MPNDGPYERVHKMESTQGGGKPCRARVEQLGWGRTLWRHFASIMGTPTLMR